MIGLSLNDTCLKEGSDASLRCNVQGFPRPTVQFQLNGVTVIPGSGIFDNYVQEFYDQVYVCQLYQYSSIIIILCIMIVSLILATPIIILKYCI